MSLNIEPGEDRVLIEAAPAEEKTASGIFIPDTAKEKPQKGTIVAVGAGKRSESTGELIPMNYKVGDVVVYGKYAGTETTHEGKDYLIMKQSDIHYKYI